MVKHAKPKTSPDGETKVDLRVDFESQESVSELMRRLTRDTATHMKHVFDERLKEALKAE